MVRFTRTSYSHDRDVWLLHHSPLLQHLRRCADCLSDQRHSSAFSAGWSCGSSGGFLLRAAFCGAILMRAFYKICEIGPCTLRIAVFRAYLEFVNRMNLPQREALRITGDALTAYTRNVARVKEKVAGHANRSVRLCKFLYVLRTPFDRTV